MKKELRFLVLEDDAGFRNVLENICAEMGKVTVVSNVEAAAKQIAQQKFQVLLLDWHLNTEDFIRLLARFQPQFVRLYIFTVPK
ncbi:MAG: hypothetical protein ACREL1_06055, partial [bacterium]